ncbi:MAG: hypothetical protein HY887_04715 [Deltaproteobacteria bacterium]|nr:hypothetical protein [Deltaproteobacteria bacterium]
MPAPSKNYTLIADTSIDADSPLDVILLTAIRDDLIHIEEWLGDSYTAAKNHNHDGVNSASATVADNAITTAKIANSAVTGAKTSKAVASTGSQTLGVGAFWTPAAGIYQMVATSIATVDSGALELFIAGAWRTAAISVSGMVFCDGSNMRINGNGGAIIYYQTF